MSLARAEGLPHQFPEGVNPEDKDKLSAEFRSSLILIQSRPLNPDTIDTYAENALSDLVDLSASITDAYRSMSPTFSGLGRDLEDQAFEHFGLKSINGVLSYVAAKDAEIKQIGRIVESAENTGQVIVPPDKIDPPTGDGNGEFKKKSVISRTKTVLFILANDFGIDLNNPDDFSIKTGVLTDTMMRGLSYYQISVPSLGRTILCCDEEGNVSYVFDNKVLEDHGITPDDLSTLTKNDINDLLDSDAKMGKRVVYSPKFVYRMVGLITDIELDISSPEPRRLYLYPKSPEGTFSMSRFAKEMGIDGTTLIEAIRVLKEKLGDVQDYRFGMNLTAGYTPEQQELIIKYLEEKGMLAPVASEGMLSVVKFSRQNGLADDTVRSAIAAMGEQIGEVRDYKFGKKKKKTQCLTIEQQEKLLNYLVESGTLVPLAPEGFLPLGKIAKMLGVSHHTADTAMQEIVEHLGYVGDYRSKNRKAAHYSPDQQELIKRRLEEKGLIAMEAPDGFLPQRAFAKSLGVFYGDTQKAIKAIGENLGDVKDYKFKNKVLKCFTPEQQELIIQYLKENNLFFQPAPEGVLWAKDLAEGFDMDMHALNTQIRILGKSLGEKQFYLFDGEKRRGFTPEQQETIRQFLEKKGFLLGKIPDGVYSLSGLADKFGIDPKTLKKVIDELEASLGEIKEYMMGKARRKSYTPEQQEMIRKRLVEKGLIAA